MKSTCYLNVLKKWYISLALLLFSCNDNPEYKKETTPPSGYSFVSIEYTLTNVSELRVPFYKRIWNNSSALEIKSENKINSQASFTSFFSEPTEKPDYPGLIGKVEVSLPKLDETGTNIGLSNMTFPLAFQTSQVKNADAEYSLSVTIPAYSTYTVSPYIIGWNVSMQYTCTVENDDTKERVVFSGEWRGDVYYRQDVYLSDEQGNIIGEFTHPINY